MVWGSMGRGTKPAKGVGTKSAVLKAKEFGKLKNVTLGQLFEKKCFDHKASLKAFEAVHGYAEFVVLSKAGVLEKRVEEGLKLGKITCEPEAVSLVRPRIGKSEASAGWHQLRGGDWFQYCTVEKIEEKEVSFMSTQTSWLLKSL